MTTGRRVSREPYRLKRDSRGALEEAILEAEVARPSAACRDDVKAQSRGLPLAKLQKLLRGDLDTIVLAALRKDPAERYASVTAFADDAVQAEVLAKNLFVAGANEAAESGASAIVVTRSGETILTGGFA